MSVSWKGRIADFICHPVVGRAMSGLLGGQIPSRGFTIDTRDKHVAARSVAYLLWGLYEKAEIDFVRHYLRSDLDVIELGSSLGVVALHILQRIGVERKLVCVEANPHLVPLIGKNLKTNASGREVAVLNRAIDYTGTGEVDFSISEDNLTSGVTASGVASGKRIKASTLGDLLGETGIKDEFALVCDIEGAEAGIIMADRDSLLRCRQIVIELHQTAYQGRDYTAEDLSEHLQATHGFRLTARHGFVYLFEK